MTWPARLTATLVATTLSSACLCQDGMSELPSVGESSVVIVNRANQSLTFSLRPAEGTWSSQAIASGANIRMVCNDCTTDRFEITLNTGAAQVRYDLPANGRYSLGWNFQKGLWDVFRE